MHINNQKNKYDHHTVVQAKYHIARIIYGRKHVLKDIIHEFQKSFTQKPLFNKHELQHILCDNFLCYNESKTVQLNESQIEAIDYIDRSSDHKFLCDTDEITRELDEVNKMGYRPVYKDLVYKFLACSISRSCQHSSQLNALFFEIASSIDDYAREVDSALSKPNFAHYPKLTDIIIHKDILDQLYAIDIDSSEKLFQMNPYVLYLLFNVRINDLYFFMHGNLDSIHERISRKINTYLSKLPSIEYEIINLRHNPKSRVHSLDEIGQRHGLSKERIRQLETRAFNRLDEQFYTQKDILFAYAQQLLEEYKAPLISWDVLLEKIGAKAFVFLLLIERYKPKHLNYNSDYHIIYNGSLINLDTYINNTLDDLPDVVEMKHIDLLKKQFASPIRSFIATILDKYYNLREGILYKHGIRISHLILSCIDDYFPEGYKISSDAHFSKIKQCFKERYGALYTQLSKRRIETSISNHGYRLVGKGKHINPNFLPELDEDLLNQIIRFINLSGGNVYYSMIFHEFKDELSEKGIDNRYMLKGVLDPKIENSFYTKRDYLSGTKDDSPQDPIHAYIDAQEESFSLRTMKREFPGLKESLLYNIIYMRDDIVWLGQGRFINKKNIHISTDFANIIQKEIEFLLSSLGEKQITGQKLYSRIIILYPDHLKKLGYINGHYDFFSLVKNLFSDVYYFKRPYISNAAITENHFDMILKHCQSHRVITKKIIDSFINRLQLYPLHSYLDFMEYLSEDFVQFDVDSMINKNAINIDNKQIKALEQALNLIYRRNSSIDTRRFKGYFIFPILELEWNKYLLVGVLRTYLNDRYAVDPTEKTYDKTDFIIRRNDL